MSAYVIARGDDWEGLYIDKRLVTEAHGLSVEAIIRKCIERPPTTITSREVDFKWLHERGEMPDNLEEVQWASPF